MAVSIITISPLKHWSSSAKMQRRVVAAPTGKEGRWLYVELIKNLPKPNRKKEGKESLLYQSSEVTRAYLLS